MKTKNVPEVLKWKINPTFFFDNRGFPNWGGGGGSAAWEFFPHNPVFFSDNDPYFFFIHVMKHKCEFNISKQFQSIVCLIFDLRYILTKNTWWFGKKSTFLTQNILLRAIAGLLSFPTIIISKNGKKYNFSARAKLRRNRFSHSKTPKHAQNWLFLTVFSFFLFWDPLFSHLE